MQCRAIRSLCYALIVALVATIAPLPFTTGTANAQLMPTYSVGVVDFVNESGVQGDILARLATDAVVVEMSKTKRYDVTGITRSHIKSEMERLDLHAPLDKLGLVRLGEALEADAMVEGSVKSVQLSGSGATRRASVTLVVQMIDQASGEVINGAVQTGSSAARVGYTPDDDSLIAEAVNNAAFLAVKTMADYVMPEATVMMQIGNDQVMLNKGVRDGMKPGMRMIVLRAKDIIGYVEIRDVSPNDCIAKVLKTMKGIASEDKARAIFDMPAISGTAKAEAPLPTGAPPAGGTRKNTGSKIGKALIAIGVIAGLALAFSGGRGGEDSPRIGASGAGYITWDPSKYGHGTNVLEYQVLRDMFETNAVPVAVLRDPTAIDAGRYKVTNLYSDTAVDSAISYYRLDTNPATAYTESNPTVHFEPYGTTHHYQVRVLYKRSTTTSTDSTDTTDTTDTTTDTTTTTTYFYTPASNIVTITAIEPVRVTDPDISPANGAEVVVADFKDALANLQWDRKDGADIYYVQVEPVIPGTGPTWKSSTIYETGSIVSLPDDQRTALANALSDTKYDNVVMRWRVYCRHQEDTSKAWIQGDEIRFTVQAMPPSP